MFCLFLILLFNLNLLNIIFSNVVLILWISSFFPWFFCKSFSGFQFLPSIQINDIIFSNLVLIVLICRIVFGNHKLK